MTVRGNEAGRSWADLAGLDPLAAVLDPGDTIGAKNRLIDRTHRRALRRAAGGLRDARVLDFGCGTGRLSRWLVGRGAAVSGVDVTPEMVDVARRLVPAAEFQAIDGETLPFADSTFDLVVTAYVLQYYVLGERSIPRELARILRPGGRVLAIEQVTDDVEALGRGGATADYVRMFADSGLTSREVVPVRLGDSRVVGAVQTRPRLIRLPGLAWLAAAEASRSSVPLIEGRYMDALFVARADPSRAD